MPSFVICKYLHFREIELCSFFSLLSSRHCIHCMSVSWIWSLQGFPVYRSLIHIAYKLIVHFITVVFHSYPEKSLISIKAQGNPTPFAIGILNYKRIKCIFYSFCVLIFASLFIPTIRFYSLGKRITFSQMWLELRCILLCSWVMH